MFKRFLYYIFLILWLSAQGVYKLDSRPFLWGNIEWEIFSGK